VHDLVSALPNAKGGLVNLGKKFSTANEHNLAVRRHHENKEDKLITSATTQKRQDLMDFIERELVSEPAVKAVIGIGSLSSGLARPDSDIDAIIFLNPFEWYIVPAEFKWRPSDRSFQSIFSHMPESEKYMQFDFARFDLAQWSDLSFEWAEARCAELQDGWHLIGLGKLSS